MDPIVQLLLHARSGHREPGVWAALRQVGASPKDMTPASTTAPAPVLPHQARTEAQPAGGGSHLQPGFGSCLTGLGYCSYFVPTHTSTFSYPYFYFASSPTSTLFPFLLLLCSYTYFYFAPTPTSTLLLLVLQLFLLQSCRPPTTTITLHSGWLQELAPRAGQYLLILAPIFFFHLLCLLSSSSFIVAFAMAMEITGNREEVPLLYWVSWLTVQVMLLLIMPFYSCSSYCSSSCSCSTT